MRIRITKNKAGETLVDYLKVLDVFSFRFRLLKKVIEGLNNNVVLMIDTNQRITQQSGEEVLADLSQAGFKPIAIKIPANPQKFLGFDVNFWSKHAVEYMIVLDLNGQSLTEQIFKPLSECDIAVGINQTEPIQNQLGIVGTNPMLLLDNCFDKKLYDSILCTRIKSNLDISGYVKEVIHEMGI